MMYHLRNEICCPRCKSGRLGVEVHVEQFPDHDKYDNDIFLSWWEVYCTECDYTIRRIDA